MPKQDKNVLTSSAISNKYIHPNFKYDFYPYFNGLREELAITKEKSNGKYAFINKEGKNVIEPQFDRVTEFKNGITTVEKNG